MFFQKSKTSKNREDSSDFDDFTTELTATPFSIMLELLHFLRFFVVFSSIFFLCVSDIHTKRLKVQKMQKATFWRIKPNVPGFFRIGFRFERIPGRSA